MFLRCFLFIIGFIFCVIGLIYDICYLNLLTIGYNFLFYVKFIFSRIECLCFLFGILIIFFSFNLKGDKNELHL